MGARGLIWGCLIGVPVGCCLGLPIFIVGGLIGLIWGGGIGARVGLLTGLLMGIVTLRFFYPLKIEQIEQYKRICWLVCAPFAGICTYVFISGGFSPVFYLIPAILAAVAAVPLSQNLAGWYIRYQAQVDVPE